MTRRRSESEWLSLLEAQKVSGQSVRSFCKSQGLCPCHFGKKQRALSGEAVTTKSTVSPPFVKTQVKRSDVSPSTWCLRWQGVELELPSATSSQRLAELMQQ